MKRHISNYKIFYIAVILVWLKTYLVSRFYFDLSIENQMQELILFISPLSSVILFFGLSLLVRKNYRNKMIALTSLIGSIIIYANVVFYRFYTDFITIPLLFQTSNASDLGSSVTSLMYWSDIVFFADFIILVLYMLIRKVEPMDLKGKNIFTIVMVAIALFTFNVGLAETQRPDLLTRTFDREMLIKNIGTFNYHIYDAVIQSKSKAQKVFAKEEEIYDVKEYIMENQVKPNEEMAGLIEGKNVIFIALESLQTFVINEDMDGHIITPFLNELIKESYYFPNFYHQTAQGKSSDSEFTIDTSWYPLPSGAVYFTHGQNIYQGLPSIMGENGYYSAVFHANNRTFWNRDMMYPSMGYDKYFDIKSFEVTEENSIGWGLKDDHFFDQSIKYLKELPEPYFSKYITLTNHFPFSLKEEDERIPEWNSNSGTLNRYFTTVNYMDLAIEKFFDTLKAEGLYEDTVFVLYGDHYGISENHNKAMAKFLEKEEITKFDTAQLQRVPLIIHIPGQEGKVIDTVGSQLDLKPTILNLLGIDTSDDIQFGSDLFSEDREDFALFRDGTYVTKQFVMTGGKCYVKPEFASEFIQESNELENISNEDIIEEELENELENESNKEIIEDEDNNTENKIESDVEVEVDSINENENIEVQKMQDGILVDMINCDPFKDRAVKDLKYSDMLIYGDLLRFIDKLVEGSNNENKSELDNEESEMKMEQIMREKYNNEINNLEQ